MYRAAISASRLSDTRPASASELRNCKSARRRRLCCETSVVWQNRFVTRHTTAAAAILKRIHRFCRKRTLFRHCRRDTFSKTASRGSVLLLESPMRIPSGLCYAIAFAVLLLRPTPMTPQTDLHQEDRQALLKILSEVENAINAQDIEALVKLMRPDCTVTWW